jgi:predicted esterase
VLPIDPCGRVVVATLQRLGYAVRYREFDGPHTVPPAVAREAIDWFTGVAAPSVQ